MIDFIKKIPTSKKLTWLFVWVYLLVIIVAIVLKTFEIDIAFILDYLQQIVIIICVSYFGKSAIENISPNFIANKNIQYGINDDVNLQEGEEIE